MSTQDLGPEFALPLAIGLDSNDESTQIISATGWHLADVELSPDKEIAAFLIKCVNHHDELVAALRNLIGIICSTDGSDREVTIEDCDEAKGILAEIGGAK